MKKKSLLKVLAIVFAVYVVLSWFIKAGYFSEGKLVADSTTPMGLFDIFRFPVITLSSSVFIIYGLVIVLIGALYGVLNKTGAYSRLVERVVEKNKNKGNKFIIFTIILFALLSSLTGLSLPLFVLVPFFVTVLLSLGYDKKDSMVSTIGAILVGNIGCTYGFNIGGYTNYFLNTGINTEILSKAIFFVIITFLLIMYVVMKNRKVKKVTKKKLLKKKEVMEEKVEIPLYYKEGNSKKSFVPIIVIGCFVMVLLIVGMYNWEIAFKLGVFNDFHSNITSNEIVKNILGNIEALGYWSNYELLIILTMATLLIAWIYNVKVKDFCDGFIKGAKEMLPVAIYMMLANIIFLLMNSNSGTMFATIANFFLKMTKNFNGVTMAVTSAIGGVFYNDFPYLLNSLNSQITTLYTDSKIYPLIAFIMQSMHGIVQLLVPTSMLLFGGLKYFGISFKEWIKYIWKYVLEILAIAIIVMIVIAFI